MFGCVPFTLRDGVVGDIDLGQLLVAITDSRKTLIDIYFVSPDSQACLHSDAPPLLVGGEVF